VNDPAKNFNNALNEEAIAMKSEERESLTISWTGGVALAVQVRGHRLTVDQPVEEGGEDRGITPVEMFVASLGTCIAYYAVRFCRRHNISTEGLAVRAEWSYREQPHRIGAIRVGVDLKGEWDAGLKERLQKVVEGCTVHHSLTHPPEIAIQVATEE
jgi:uncharacterized OsmC-like protein